MRRTIKDKMQFIEALFRDSGVTPAGKVVGARLMIYFNTATERCNPSRATLARECGMSESAIKTVISTLERQGWFTVARSGQATGWRTATNTFKPIWDRSRGAETGPMGSELPPYGGEINQGVGVNSGPRVGAESNPKHKKKIEHGNLKPESETNARPSGSLTCDPSDHDDEAEEPSFLDSPSLPLALSEPVEPEPVKTGVEIVPLNGRRRLVSTDLDSFPSWYAQYPRKAARGAAEKAYARIIKAGEATADELLAGVTRYAATVDGTDPRYVKHPASWLNAKCWLDEPEPQGQRSGPRSRADSAIDGMAELLNERGIL